MAKFPQVRKRDKKQTRGRSTVPPEWILGRADNLSTAFQNATDEFWAKVKLIREAKPKTPRDKINAGQNALAEIKLRGAFPASIQGESLPEAFVLTFTDAVMDAKFPARRKPQAKFLGESLGASGEVSGRRSRDICGEERAKQRRDSEPIELYIKCCGKKRWTENQVCPQCKRDPLFRLHLAASMD